MGFCESIYSAKVPLIFYQSSAKEMGQWYKSHAIAPGVINTGMNSLSSEEEEELTNSIPMGVLRANDIRSSSFLCSEKLNILTDKQL